MQKKIKENKREDWRVCILGYNDKTSNKHALQSYFLQIEKAFEFYHTGSTQKIKQTRTRT